MFDDDINDGIYGSEIVVVLIAVIALICTSSVVFILCYEHAALLKGRPFIHFILNIAICDAFTSLSYSWGFVNPKRSFACKAQGFLSIYFSRASWLWTDVLISQLYYFVLYKELYLTMPVMHGIVWISNSILQFIPMMYVNYGAWDDDEDIVNNQLCFYSSQGNDAQAVNISKFAYFFILSLSLGLNFIVCILIFCRTLRASRTGGPLLSRDDLWKKMILYPIGLMIAWVPNLFYNWFCDAYLNVDADLPRKYAVVDNYLTAINNLYGIILSIFFFTQNIDARRLFYIFIKHKIFCTYDDDSDTQKIQMRISDISVAAVDRDTRLTRIEA